jgi:hypothetical protein
MYLLAISGKEDEGAYAVIDGSPINVCGAD